MTQNLVQDSHFKGNFLSSNERPPPRRSTLYSLRRRPLRCRLCPTGRHKSKDRARIRGSPSQPTSHNRTSASLTPPPRSSVATLVIARRASSLTRSIPYVAETPFLGTMLTFCLG